MSKSIKCINQQICQLLDTKTYRLASAFDTKRHIHVPALSVMHKLALTKKPVTHIRMRVPRVQFP